MISSLLCKYQRFTTRIALVCILGSFFAFGLFHINQFITADEHYWLYERIPTYWNALDHGNWKKTFINDKPGISLALISGAGLFLDAHPETICQEDESQIDRCDEERAVFTLLAFRIPLLVANVLLLLLIYWLLSKLYSNQTALLATCFIALSPMLIGMTQIINPDALLWSFGTSALLSFLALLKLRETKYILLSGVLFGFALLSKYTAGFLIPFFIFLIFADVLFPKDHPREILKERTLANIRFLLTVLGIGVFTLAFFLPAIWLKPSLLINLLSIGSNSLFLILLFLSSLGIFGIIVQKKSWLTLLVQYTNAYHTFSRLEKILSILLIILCITLILGRIFFPEWTTFEKIPFDLKDLYSSDKLDKGYFPNTLETMLLEMNPLIFSVSPVILLSFLFKLYSNIFPQKNIAEKKIEKGKFEDFSLLLFVFLFLIAMLLSEVLATARYLILLYPLIAILAASGVQRLSERLRIDFPRIRKLLIPGALLSAFVSVLIAAPFYFNYTNFLLPQEKIIHHSWGLGGYEAAQYLNSLPNAEQLLIWSDYYGVCEFFKGRCLTLEYEAAAKQHFDYAVLSYRGRNLYRPEHSRWKKSKNLQMSAAYASLHPDWQLLIGHRSENFVKIIKVQE